MSSLFFQLFFLPEMTRIQDARNLAKIVHYAGPDDEPKNEEGKEDVTRSAIPDQTR